MAGAPTYWPGQTDADIAAHQGQQQSAGEMNDPQAVALNTALQQTPAYQNWVASMKQGNLAARQQAASALKAEGDRIGIPDNLIFDPLTGVVRDKNWNERNSNWSALMYTGAAIGAGLTAGAATAALGGAGAAAGAAGAGAEAGGLAAGGAAAGGAAAGGTAAAGAGAGAAGLGGTLASTLIKNAPAIATALGGAAKGQQAQNNTETGQQLTQEQIQLNRDKYALEAPNTRLATALKASIASNYTPQHTTFAGPGSGLRGQAPTITGGLSASLANLDPRAKELANQILMDELTGQKQGGPTGGGQDKTLSPINQSSTGDKVLGGASLGSSILGSIFASAGKGKTSSPSSGSTPAQPGNGYETVGTGYEPVGPPDPPTGGLSDDDLYQMMMQGNT